MQNVLFSVPGSFKLCWMYKGRCMWKEAEVSNMQDLLIYVTKGLSYVATALRKEGKEVSKKLADLYQQTFCYNN